MEETKDTQTAIDVLRSALLTVLDQVDYTAGNCQINAMVGAVLPREVIAIAWKALQDTRSPTLRAVVTPSTQADVGWDGTTHYEQTEQVYDESFDE